MSRRKARNVHGIVLLDKPAGLSSNQAVQRVRRMFDARKAGHTGSLDPFATGLLPVCLGEATKTAAFMLEADKTYRATALLGVATETGDTEGDVARELPVPSLEDAEVRDILARFEGAISQVPPMYSALKHEGKPLYRLAREGIEVRREARRVHIHELRLCRWAPPELEFEVHCSKGTYVRTLAEDLAAAMDSCAHLAALRRLSVGRFHGERMHSLERLEQLQAAGDLEGCCWPWTRAWPIGRGSTWRPMRPVASHTAIPWMRRRGAWYGCTVPTASWAWERVTRQPGSGRNACSTSAERHRASQSLR